MNTIITIGRQYGSGGREIGERLAKEFSIPFYDKELLNIAAKESGICKELFETNDEQPTNSLLYSLVVGSYVDMPLNHKIFLAQFDAIKKIAADGPCVIVGRCADYALRDFPNCVNLFIQSDLEKRIDRAVQCYELPAEGAREAIIKIDKKRANYYNHYSSKRWGAAENYNLCLDSGLIGIDNSIALIKSFVEMKEAYEK